MTEPEQTLNYLSDTNTNFQSFPEEPEENIETTQQGSLCYHRYQDPTRNYVKKPAQCAINPIVKCPLGSTYFRDQCGCGCKRFGNPIQPKPRPRPVGSLYACPRVQTYCVSSPTCGYATDGRTGNFRSVCEACGNPLTYGYRQGYCNY